ncbi:MAG: hypothetical protein ABS884_09300, partial [Solibacillus isronensis]
RRGANMMLVTKALPQDVALLAFVPKSQASVLLSLRFRRKINFAVPAGVATPPFQSTWLFI